MNPASLLLYYFGLAGEIVLFALFFRGPYRTYPLLFAYCVAQLISTLSLSWTIYGLGRESDLYRRLYWSFEILFDISLFLAVISMIFKVVGESPMRRQFGRMLTALATAVIISPFLLYYERSVFSTAWFNGASQVLNFGVALMTLGLWTALLSGRQRDLRLLAISAGLGIAVTGSAISFGARQFFATGVGRDIANLIGQLAYDGGLFVWCWAFSRQWSVSLTRPSPG